MKIHVHVFKISISLFYLLLSQVHCILIVYIRLQPQVHVDSKIYFKKTAPHHDGCVLFQQM